MKADAEEDSDPDLTPEEAELIEKNRLKALERYDAHLAKKKEEAEKAMEEAEKAKAMAEALRASTTSAPTRDPAPTKNTSGHPVLQFSTSDVLMEENAAPNLIVKTEVTIPDGKEEKLVSGTNARGKTTTMRMFTQGGYFVAENQ